jgi:uncharacterized protein
MGRGRILLEILLLASALLWSEPVRTLHPSNYVNDFAHVLSGETVAELDDISKQLDDKAHAQVAVVTINSLDGSDVESYAHDLFQKWGIGAKATNRGVLILFAIKDHKYRTEVGYGLEPILPDGKVGGFGREAVPLLQQNDYNGAVRLVTRRVADVIASDAGIQLTGEAEQAPPRRSPSGGISVGGIILLILLLIIVLGTPLRSLLWLLLFSNLGGGYRGGGWGGGGWGGGGFGGGGGGFGGFGGGMSGGGGASGSW